MKKLKFYKYLADLIIKGEKTTTWRLFDDKDLHVGDQLILSITETGKEFAQAEILTVKEKKLSEITDEDYDGQVKYSSPEEMYKTFQGFHKDQSVGPDTLVKVIKFALIERGIEDM